MRISVPGAQLRVNSRIIVKDQYLIDCVEGVPWVNNDSFIDVKIAVINV